MVIASVLKKELNKRQKKNARYSLRSFAKLLNADSSFLSKVMQGKKYPSEETFRDWSERLGISAKLTADLLHNQKLVRQAKRDEASAFEPLALEIFEKHYEWYYPLLLEFLAKPGGRGQLASVAKQLGVPLSEIKTAVANMLALGLLEKIPGEGDQYRRARFTSTHSLNLTSDRLRAMQVKYLETAIKAINHIPVTRRENTTVTLSLDAEDLSAVREILRKARQKVARVVIDKNKPRGVVYNVSMALYPVLESEVIK
jgi:hypothetical protein